MTNYSRPPLSDETNHKLKILKAVHGFRSMDTLIDHMITVYEEAIENTKAFATRKPVQKPTTRR